MPADAKLQMAVEAPQERVRLIRVAGNLDRAAAARLLRLIDAQLQLLAARYCRVSDLLVDLEGVSSFERGGLEALRHARHSGDARGVRIHLTGCSGRLHLLPLRACQLLSEFQTFPTVEVALAQLARTTAAPPAGTAAAGGPETEPDADAPDRRQDARRHQQRHDGPGDLNRASRPSPPLPDTAAFPSPRSAPEREPSTARRSRSAGNTRSQR